MSTLQMYQLSVPSHWLWVRWSQDTDSLLRTMSEIDVTPLHLRIRESLLYTIENVFQVEVQPSLMRGSPWQLDIFFSQKKTGRTSIQFSLPDNNDLCGSHNPR